MAPVPLDVQHQFPQMIIHGVLRPHFVVRNDPFQYLAMIHCQPPANPSADVGDDVRVVPLMAQNVEHLPQHPIAADFCQRIMESDILGHSQFAMGYSIFLTLQDPL
jgi:hypothetical protein